MKIKIKVKPNSKKQEIKKSGDIYEVRVKSVAEDNKANIELLKLLKKYFNKPVKIIKGMKSKNKVIKLE